MILELKMLKLIKINPLVLYGPYKAYELQKN